MLVLFSFVETKEEKETKDMTGWRQQVISLASVFTLIVGELPNHAQGKIDSRVHLQFPKVERR